MSSKNAPALVSSKPDLFKAQQAIAIVPASGSRITLLMRRFFNVLLRHAQNVGHSEIYCIPFSEAISEGGFSGNNVEIAKEALRAMAKTTVEWNYAQERADSTASVRDWGITSLLSHARLFSKGNRVFLEWSYSPIMSHEILDPQRYVPLSLRIYGALTTGSSAALYEICKRYITNTNGLSRKETIEWWRPRITGISIKDEESFEYKYFKRDVLTPVIREINEITDIEVELLEFKTGKKITHIQFMSRQKAQQAMELAEPAELVNQGILDRMLAFGIKQELANKIYVANSEDDLLAALEFVEAKVTKGGVDSPAGLFRDALKKGYGKRASSPAQKAKVKAAAEDEKLSPESIQAEANRMKAQEYLDSLSAEDMRDLRVAFEQNISGLVLEQYKKSGMKSKIVRVAMNKYVLDAVLAEAY